MLAPPDDNILYLILRTFYSLKMVLTPHAQYSVLPQKYKKIGLPGTYCTNFNHTNELNTTVHFEKISLAK